MRGYEAVSVLELIQASQENNQQRIDELFKNPKIISKAIVALIDAASDAKIDVIHALLSFEQIMRRAPGFSKNLLMYAVRYTKSQVIRYLIKIPTIISNAIDEEMSVMEAAIEEDHFEVLDALRQSSDFNNNYLYFQLVEAAREGNLPLVDALLKNPFVFNQASAFENNALVTAFEEGNTEVVKRLLEIDSVVANLSEEVMESFCQGTDEPRICEIDIFDHLLQKRPMEKFISKRPEAYLQLLYKLLHSIDKRNPKVVIEYDREGNIIARKRLLIPSPVEIKVIGAMNKIAQDHTIVATQFLRPSEEETFLSHLPEGLGIFDQSNNPIDLELFACVPVLSFTAKREKLISSTTASKGSKIAFETANTLTERSDTSSGSDNELTKRTRRK